jgi:hypothetical protein
LLDTEGRGILGLLTCLEGEEAVHFLHGAVCDRLLRSDPPVWFSLFVFDCLALVGFDWLSRIGFEYAVNRQCIGSIVSEHAVHSYE